MSFVLWRDKHRKIVWVIDHLVLLYVAVAVSVLLFLFLTTGAT